MKALFIGGTGTISTEISKRCVSLGWELTLLNRGNAKQRAPEGARLIQADVHDEDAVRRALGDERFDVAAEFVAYTPQEVERDIRLLEGRVGQYLFISSASAYQKPLSMPLITESTPLCNPYWEYSRNKAACEETLMRAYRERDFPVTIVRPSHTYCQRSVPVALHGAKGSYQVLCRMRQGKKIIIPGDGLTLWTVTHSRDFAVAFEGLMGNPQALGECFHITGDERLTWNQITYLTGQALGVEPKLCHIASETLALLNAEWRGALLGDKSNNAVFDNQKLRRAVPGFCAQTRFDRGVREAVAYIDAHPECQTPDEAFDRWCDETVEAYERLAQHLPRLNG